MALLFALAGLTLDHTFEDGPQHGAARVRRRKSCALWVGMYDDFDEDGEDEPPVFARPLGLRAMLAPAAPVLTLGLITRENRLRRTEERRSRHEPAIAEAVVAAESARTANASYAANAPRSRSVAPPSSSSSSSSSPAEDSSAPAAAVAREMLTSSIISPSSEIQPEIPRWAFLRVGEALAQSDRIVDGDCEVSYLDVDILAARHGLASPSSPSSRESEIGRGFFDIRAADMFSDDEDEPPLLVVGDDGALRLADSDGGARAANDKSSGSQCASLAYSHSSTASVLSSFGVVEETDSFL